MFLPFLGLSVFVHLLIIIIAKIIHWYRGEQLYSVFQVTGRRGGVVQSPFINALLSYTLMLTIAAYMVTVVATALLAAIRIGVNEPHRQAYRYLADTMVTAFGAVEAVVGIMAVAYVLLVIRRPARVFFFPQVAAGALAVGARGVYALAKMLVAVPRQVMIVGRFLTRILPDTTSRSGVTTTRFMVMIAVVSLVSVVASLAPLLASAQIVEPGFESEVVASGLSLGTAMAFLPDGRILVAQKGGAIRVIKEDVLLATPLVRLTDVNNFGDRGLLGLAVDPNFAANGFIYVSYTHENTPGVDVAGPKTGRIARLTVVGDTASEASKVTLVGSVGGMVGAASCEDYDVTADCIPADSNTHSVGALRFGPAGLLYASMGDGADFVTVDERATRAQNLDSLAGKILRINPDGTAPASNPFYNGDPNANRSKVYALGVRNAFRVNFHPVTGQLYIGDVGWGGFESLYLGAAGANYGWPCVEGSQATAYDCIASSPVTDPLYAYAHGQDGASIIAGAFPDKSAYPDEYSNSFFIADYAQQWIKRLELDATGTVVLGLEDFTTGVFPVDLVAGPDGTIYYIDIVYGTLNRITHTEGNRRPVVAMDATPESGELPLAVSFSSMGTYDPDGDALTYEWRFADGASSSVAYPTHTYVTAGSYNASLLVTDTAGASAATSQMIYAGNQSPVVWITNPSSGYLYTAGEELSIVGEATDFEDGTLAPSAFSWEVRLHHNVHYHTLVQTSGRRSIEFPAPDHNASDVYIEVIMTVTDSQGVESTQSINLYLNNGVGSGNLVSNPSLEIESTLGGSPRDWSQSIYGTLSAAMTYPVAGLAGSQAAQITVSGYENGAAKWLFSPVFVTPGAQYVFSNLYTATTPTEVLVQYTRTDGSYEYEYLSTVPAQTVPTRNSFWFTVPAGVVTATVFHEITSNGTLLVDDFAVLLVTGSDSTPPFGSIANIDANQVVAGAQLVTVTAGDDVAVGSVQLLVNGNEVGVSTSEAPYRLTWDTAAHSDGAQVLSARISDTAGNTYDTPGLSVTVENGQQVLPNLIQNGDFEIADGNVPLGWQQGGGGTLTSEFRYPVPGRQTGSVAAEVEITEYELGDEGDARWVHAAVPVESGIEYTYQSYYKATTISDVIGRYTFTDGSDHHFGVQKEIPAADNWTLLEQTFVPPPGVETVTLIHLISSEATLTIDDVALYATGTGTPSEINPPDVAWLDPTPQTTVSGVVTLTATSSDDTEVVGVYFAVNGDPYGDEVFTAPYTLEWNTAGYPDGQYVLKATSHDIYGNNDTAEIIVTLDNNATPPPDPDPKPPLETDNLVSNGNLETVAPSGDPLGWNRGGWGENTRSYTYPVPGQTGTGAMVTIDSYTSGDAKWYADSVVVTPGEEYQVSSQYVSTIPVMAMLQYTLVAGGYQYEYIDTVPATDGTWETFDALFVPPAGVEAVTLFQLITAVGSVTVDDVAITPVTVVDPDPTPAPAISLVQNADLETVAPSGDPLGWNRGGWGENTRSYTYPVPGQTGTGAMVTIDSYTSGDAKWYADPVLVVSGSEYEVGMNYLSSAASDVLVRYTRSDGSLSYDYLASLPATGDTWQQYSELVLVPADTVELTLFQVLATTGSLTVDNAVVRGATVTEPDVPPPDPEPEPDPTPDPVPANNLLVNGSLETVAPSGDPLGWNRGGWGENDRTLTYPVVSYDGQAAQVRVTSYTSGDTKWFADPVAVVAGETYTFNYEYQATVPTSLTLAYTMTDGSISYIGLAPVPAATDWRSDSVQFTAPAGAEAVSVWHILSAAGTLLVNTQSLTTGNANTLPRGAVSFSFDDGWLEHATIAGPALSSAGMQGTFYVITDIMLEGTSPGFVDRDDVLALSNAGHEIGGHTRTHPSLLGLSSAELESEIAGSRADLLAIGVPSITTFAYPFGEYDAVVQQATAAAGYTLGRGVERGFNDRSTSPYALRIQQVDRASTVAEMTAWIDAAAANNVWLILMFHQISADPAANLGITEEDFTALVAHTAGSEVDVVTIAAGLSFLE